MFALRRAALPPSRAFFSTTARAPMAKICLIGHLADTPEVQATSTGNDIIKYSLASNSGPKDNRQVSWWNVAAFVDEGPRKELLRTLEKGTMVYVEGDAKMDTWQDDTGKNRSTLKIVQRSLEILKRPNAPSTM